MILVNNFNKKVNSEVLADFRLLSKKGSVPKGSQSGHEDGWGVVVYKGRRIILFRKEGSSAIKSKAYKKIIEEIRDLDSNIVIGHLRKASTGKNKFFNSHPFVLKNFSFCQNGTIFNSKRLPLTDEFENLIKGETDSERFFVYILQCINNIKDKKQTSNSIQKGILKAVSFVKKNFDYTALNFLLTDGKNAWALREINEKSELVKRKKMLEYYTLYIGHTENSNSDIVSSEKIAPKGVRWKQFNNHELLRLDIQSGTRNIASIDTK